MRRRRRSDHRDLACASRALRERALPAAIVLPTLGASGAVFGVLLAYSLTWPDRTIMLLFPPIPIKAIYFIPFIFFLMGWMFGRRQHQPCGPPRRRPGRVDPAAPDGNDGRGSPSSRSRYRWRRYRMRRNLRAVRMEELPLAPALRRRPSDVPLGAHGRTEMPEARSHARGREPRSRDRTDPTDRECGGGRGGPREVHRNPARRNSLERTRGRDRDGSLPPSSRRDPAHRQRQRADAHRRRGPGRHRDPAQARPRERSPRSRRVNWSRRSASCPTRTPPET